MALKLFIDCDANCAVVVHDEMPSMGSIYAQLEDLGSHPDHRPGMNILRDLRAVHLPEEMGFDWFVQNRNRMAGIDLALGSCRIAAVSATLSVFGVVKQISTVTADSSVERRPFKDMREAKRWLGLPDDYRLDLVPND